MFGGLLSRFQSPSSSEKPRHPAWYERHFAPVLLWVAKKACTHPVHTIVMVACVASYSYLGVLDQGLLQRAENSAGKVDFDTLLAGSQRLRLGKETGWKWEAEEIGVGNKYEQVYANCPFCAMLSNAVHRRLKTSPLLLSSSPILAP